MRRRCAWDFLTPSTRAGVHGYFRETILTSTVIRAAPGAPVKISMVLPKRPPPSAYGKGQTAQQSSELRQAMAEAHLPPAFNNYFLTGVQTGRLVVADELRAAHLGG